MQVITVQKTWNALNVRIFNTYVYKTADEKKPEFRFKPVDWHLWLRLSCIEVQGNNNNKILSILKASVMQSSNNSHNLVT